MNPAKRKLPYIDSLPPKASDTTLPRLFLIYPVRLLALNPKMPRPKKSDPPCHGTAGRWLCTSRAGLLRGFLQDQNHAHHQALLGGRVLRILVRILSGRLAGVLLLDQGDFHLLA